MTNWDLAGQHSSQEIVDEVNRRAPLLEESVLYQQRRMESWGSRERKPLPWVAEHPADCIDLRRELVEWWSRDGEIQRTLAMQNRIPIPGEAAPWQRQAKDARQWYHDVLSSADLYWISPEMIQLLEAVAPKMIDCLPRPPVAEAFVILAKPMAGIDAKTGIKIHTAAYLWGPVLLRNRAPSIAIDTFGWRDFMEPQGDHGEMWDKKHEDTWRQAMPTKLVATGGGEWDITKPTSYTDEIQAQTEDARASLIEDRRVISAFWALCQEKLIRQTLEPGDRYAQKRARRANIKNLDPVRVIKLREVVHGSEEATGKSIEYSHRWIVSGHWRNQYYPSVGEHRPKFIAPYPKGPKDKPLVIRPTVRALVR